MELTWGLEMKVVINRRYGGFGLSGRAEELYKERKGITDPKWWYYNIERNDPVLVELVEELGSKVNTRYSELAVVEIPDDVEWEINEYDGWESIHEKHRVWN